MLFPLYLFAIGGGLFAGMGDVVPKSDMPAAGEGNITSLAQYNNMIQSFNQMISIGDYKGAYFSGLLYMRDFDFDGVKVSKDLEKAKYYFNMAFDGGMHSSVIYLSLLYSNSKEVDKAMLVLDRALNEKEVKKKPEFFFSVATIFASFVLEYKYENKFAVKKAIEYLLPVTLALRSHRGAFFLAFLYDYQNDSHKSQSMLNLACFGKNVPYNIKQACFNSNIIKVEKNNDTNETNITK